MFEKSKDQLGFPVILKALFLKNFKDFLLVFRVDNLVIVGTNFIDIDLYKYVFDKIPIVNQSLVFGKFF